MLNRGESSLPSEVMTALDGFPYPGDAMQQLRDQEAGKRGEAVDKAAKEETVVGVFVEEEEELQYEPSSDSELGSTMPQPLGLRAAATKRMVGPRPAGTVRIDQ